MAALSGASAAAQQRRTRGRRSTAAGVAVALGLLVAGQAFVAGAPRAPLRPVARTGLRAEGESTAIVAAKPSLSPLMLALKPAGLGMSLLRPLFALEAKLQALFYDQAEIQGKIAADVKSAPVVIYTYSLSPFCTEAVALLKSLDVDFKEIVLAPEWFLMLGEGAAKRAELGELYGRTSMPHIFIGGESVGGLADGTPGLLPLFESGELDAKLKAAGGLPQAEEESKEFNPFSFFDQFR